MTKLTAKHTDYFKSISKIFEQDKKEIFKKIVEINEEIIDSSVIKEKILIYSEKEGGRKKLSEEAHDKQSGKLWLLVGWSTKDGSIDEKNPVSVTAGQSLDIFDELIKISGFMFPETEDKKINNSKKEKQWRDIREKYVKLIFYEVSIDDYLEAYVCIEGQTIEALKETAFEIVKEYYAEAMLAYTTNAVEWNFYNSGMDKRSYVRIDEYFKEKVKKE